MKIEMKIILDIGENFINHEDTEEREWLMEKVLKNYKQLHLHSNEIGDTVGDVIGVENISYTTQHFVYCVVGCGLWENLSLE